MILNQIKEIAQDPIFSAAALDLVFDLEMRSVTLCEFHVGLGLLLEFLENTCIYDDALRSTGTDYPCK